MHNNTQSFMDQPGKKGGICGICLLSFMPSRGVAICTVLVMIAAVIVFGLFCVGVISINVAVLHGKLLRRNWEK